jgi:spermidine synthase
LRIGILGLGAGVTAALARPQDTLHYYEINPLVVDIATNQFDFLRECPADKKILMGDGRLVLENLPASENLDVLAMDAFSSDSVPLHLLTREAYQLYLRHLKPNGVLIINISNRYLDLEPPVARAAAEMGWHALVVADDGEGESYYTASTFIVLSHSAEFFKHKFFAGYSNAVALNRPEFRTWTDDYSNIIQILKK